MSHQEMFRGTAHQFRSDAQEMRRYIELTPPSPEVDYLFTRAAGFEHIAGCLEELAAEAERSQSPSK
jgi:hypothetical protein